MKNEELEQRKMEALESLAQEMQQISHTLKVISMDLKLLVQNSAKK